MNITARARELQDITIVPAGGALGADVVGVDMRRALDEDEVALIEQAWADHMVLRFRGNAGLTADELTAFSRHFGSLDKRPVRGVINGGTNDLPLEINVISNIKVDGKPVGGLGSDEADWHSDMTYKEIPPKGSCLFSVEIPPVGGRTFFANMQLAYETLSTDMKRRIETLQCVHDASRNSTGELRQGYEDITDPRKTVGAVHPVVRMHPVTGRKCLFLGRRRNAYLVGLTLDESEALLDELWAHAVTPDKCWAQEWQLGDAVLWDNRCTMHRREAFDANSRRLMYRTQIAGESVV